MSCEEFQSWKLVYHKVAPFGEQRADMRAGSVISPLLNLLKSYLFKSPKMSKPSDWILEMERQKPEKPKLEIQSLTDMQAVCKALSNAAKQRRK